MSATAKKMITMTAVEAMPTSSLIWDVRVIGFHARRQRSPAIVYGVRYRLPDGTSRVFRIGRHGAPWTPDMARDEAKRLLAEVARGNDPSSDRKAKREALTMAGLCDQYLNDMQSGRLLVRAGRGKKPSTISTDASRISAHIIPLLGKKAVASITKKDVDKFLHDVAEGKTAKRIHLGRPRAVSVVRGGEGTATRTLSLLSAIMTYAIDRGHRSDNPCARVHAFAENRRDRRVSDTEFGQLGTALDQASDGRIWIAAPDAARFLALTGWRLGEALTLKRSDIDAERGTAILGDTKTGRSMRPLSAAALAVIARQVPIGDSPYVFPSSKGTPMSGFRAMWLRMIELANLPIDITPHTLRHSFASTAADLGYSESTIGALIGHKSQTITGRYVHHADAPLIAAADRVAEHIAALMEA